MRGLQRASGAPSVTEDDGPADIDVGTEPSPLDAARLYWPLSSDDQHFAWDPIGKPTEAIILCNVPILNLVTLEWSILLLNKEAFAYNFDGLQWKVLEEFSVVCQTRSVVVLNLFVLNVLKCNYVHCRSRII